MTEEELNAFESIICSVLREQCVSPEWWLPMSRAVSTAAIGKKGTPRTRATAATTALGKEFDSSLLPEGTSADIHAAVVRHLTPATP